MVCYHFVEIIPQSYQDILTSTNGGRGGSCPPPQFGQFVDMNSGRESTLFGQNTIHV